MKIRNIWPLIVLLIYLLLTMKAFVYFCAKILQDSCRFKLKQIEKSIRYDLQEGNESDLVLNSMQSLADYSAKLKTINRFLKQLGDPFINVEIVIQPIMINLLTFALVTYIVPQILFNSKQYDFFLVRLVLYEREEFANCKQMIHFEIKRLASSSRNFLAWTRQLSLEGARPAKNGFASSNGSAQSNVAELNGLARCGQDHWKLMRQLQRLSKSGALHPINRASPEWTDQLIGQFCRFSIRALTYWSLYGAVIFYCCPWLTDYELEFDSLADNLFTSELFILYEIGAISMTYHGTQYFVSVINKIRYLQHMRQQLIDCIRDNEREFAQYLNAINHMTTTTTAFASNTNRLSANKKAMLETCSNKLNSNLIECYLRYRIFMAELDEVRTQWPFAISICLGLMLVVPIMFRLYIPYITDPRTNLIVLATILLVIFYVNLILLPLCIFSQGGERIYRTMCSLLAHCMDLQLQSRLGLGNYRPIYMEHIVEIIRKELNEPTGLVGKFSTTWNSFTATFANLVRLHLYYGLILMSLFFETESWRKLFGSRLNDPLGLLKL